MRVLVVEDDSVTQRILARMLKIRGHEVVATLSAEEAQRIFATEFFSLIFLDLNLPGLSGLDLSRWIRQQPWGDQVYILMGTATVLKEKGDRTLTNILAAGADDYLSKPYSPERLNVRLSVAEKQVAQIERRKELEATLKRERDFITAVVDTAAALILVIDADQNILTMNPWCVRLIGMELTPPFRFPQAFIVPEDREKVEAKLEELRKVLRPVTFDATVQNSSGKEYYVSWTATLTTPENPEMANIICSGIDITERHLAEERLAFLATRDPLTELFNRNYLPLALEAAMERSAQGIPGALLSLDLDDFKIVNDTVGHAAGDRLLIAIARLLREGSRPADTIVRIGGDEFLIFLDDVDLSEARAVADRIRGLVHAFIFIEKDLGFGVTTSIGIVMLDSLVPMEQWLVRADSACYTAKSHGRNRIEVFQDTDRTTRLAQEETNWKNRINEALRDGSFELWFQPVVEIATRRLLYEEVLLRLREPDGSIILPGAFLPAAERMGMMTLIDLHVLRLASSFLQSNLKLRLSINLSGQSMGDSHLATWIDQLIGSIPAGPERVNFEITETRLIENLAQADETICNLREKGYRFALDDFGAGFASFGYLKNLTIDFLKIDGAFVLDLPNQPSNQSFVRAMNEIAHQMKMKSVAEFVEDEATFTLLRSIGVDYAQGHYFSAPRSKPSCPGALSSTGSLKAK